MQLILEKYITSHIGKRALSLQDHFWEIDWREKKESGLIGQ